MDSIPSTPGSPGSPGNPGPPNSPGGPGASNAGPPVRCAADQALTRITLGSFQFPLGVYPLEAMEARPGYEVLFESADGDDDEGEWEEWPDRYCFTVAISNERVPLLVQMLLSLMPGRIYPILDILGQDAFREIDPYVSYELTGQDRVVDALRRFKDFFFEDGMVGFGGLCEEPFFYFFVDEHKLVTIRCEPGWKDKIERLLQAFDLQQVDEVAGADYTRHEHRGVLVAPQDRPDLLSPEQVLEFLRDQWALVLNIDPESNVDDEGQDLGLTCWRCVVRCGGEDASDVRYAEILLKATCLREAEDLAIDSLKQLRSPKDAPWVETVFVAQERLLGSEFVEALAKMRRPPVKSGDDEPKVYAVSWAT
ncbi:MAG: hypothetical protein SFZ23_10710 [Planctomycetota bacterium]|nr:hypothetical protein [Planctomycetota bacterium]